MDTVVCLTVGLAWILNSFLVIVVESHVVFRKLEGMRAGDMLDLLEANKRQFLVLDLPDFLRDGAEGACPPAHTCNVGVCEVFQNRQGGGLSSTS